MDRTVTRIARLVIVFAGAMSVAACSLMLGEGYTSEPEGADAASTTTDGSAGRREASPGDAADASTNDAPMIAPLCEAGAMTFCDDFERPAPQGEWSTAVATSGATLQISADGQGRRLEAVCPSKGANALLARTLQGKPSHLHFEVTLEYATLPTTGGVYVMGIAMSPSGSASGLTLLYVYANQDLGITFVQQVTGTASYRADVLAAATPGAPHRIAVDVVIGGKVTVSVDGTALVDRAAESFLQSGAPKITLGAGSIDDTGAGFRVLADDFVFTAD